MVPDFAKLNNYNESVCVVYISFPWVVSYLEIGHCLKIRLENKIKPAACSYQRKISNRYQLSVVKWLKPTTSKKFSRHHLSFCWNSEVFAAIFFFLVVIVKTSHHLNYICFKLKLFLFYYRTYIDYE